MFFKSSKDLNLILHPYAFILKGGKQINHNLLDYQLMMLQISCPETIKSPDNARAEIRSFERTFSFAKNPVQTNSNKEQGLEI